MNKIIKNFQETRHLYNKSGVVVRQSILGDVNYLKNHLRRSDVNEIWASHNSTPEEALFVGFYESSLCLTVESNKLPCAMFGINSHNLLSREAIVWFLASPELEKIKIRFLRHSMDFVDLMLRYYPVLYNWVDSRNYDSIEWLIFCGAKLEEPKRFGVQQLPFHYFVFRREDENAI